MLPKYLTKPKRLIPAVFMHIQKTAGTSIITSLRTHYKNQVISHADYQKWNSEDLSQVPFVSGHFGYDYAKQIIASRYSFTFLRNPADRILSLYFHCRENEEDYPIYRLAKKYDLESFLRIGLKKDSEIHPHLWNNQTWSLAIGWGNSNDLNPNDTEECELLNLATEHLQEFTHVGFLDTYDEDLAIIKKALKVKLSKERLSHKCNTSSNSRNQPEISNTALNIITELTNLDRQIYESAWVRRTR